MKIIRKSILTDRDEIGEYERLIENSRNSMLGHSLRYLNLLQKFTGAEPIYILIKVDGLIVGVLPTLLRKNSKYGNVLNSLPFYGMHGGVVVYPNSNPSIKKTLIKSFIKIAEENDCISSTLVTSPFERDLGLYESFLKPDFVVKRRTQMVFFSEKFESVENEILYETVESRCKRAIRKAQRCGLKVEWAENSSRIEEFYELHKIGMEKKGAYKPKKFFEMVFNEMKLGSDFNLLYAVKDEKIIAGLLLFYYKDMVEYFTPAFDLAYSSLQPNSFLIYEAMKDALLKGYRIWNFGGTGWSMKSLHRFKRGWGAKDFQYHLLVNEYDGIENIKSLKAEEIQLEYPWFYVIPFKRG